MARIGLRRLSDRQLDRDGRQRILLMNIRQPQASHFQQSQERDNQLGSGSLALEKVVERDATF